MLIWGYFVKWDFLQNKEKCIFHWLTETMIESSK